MTPDHRVARTGPNCTCLECADYQDAVPVHGTGEVRLMGRPVRVSDGARFAFYNFILMSRYVRWQRQRSNMWVCGWSCFICRDQWINLQRRGGRAP